MHGATGTGGDTDADRSLDTVITGTAQNTDANMRATDRSRSKSPGSPPSTGLTVALFPRPPASLEVTRAAVRTPARTAAALVWRQGRGTGGQGKGKGRGRATGRTLDDLLLSSPSTGTVRPRRRRASFEDITALDHCWGWDLGLGAEALLRLYTDHVGPERVLDDGTGIFGNLILEDLPPGCTLQDIAHCLDQVETYMSCPMPQGITVTTGRYPDRTTASLSFDFGEHIVPAALCFLHCHTWDHTLRHWVPVQVRRQPV